MTECSTLLASVLAGERTRWRCREVAPDTVLLVTVQEMADAVADLDGLRLLAPTPRRLAFPERLMLPSGQPTPG